MKLNERQKRFADYYIELGNTEEAARKAGYSEKYARAQSYKLLANVGIKTYIDERMVAKDKERIASQDEVLAFLTQVLRGEVVEEIPLGEGMGAQRLEMKELGGKDRLKAAELLGKRYSLWTEKQQVEMITPIFVDDVDEED
ncbi:terminase small subunit [Priestia flexa]|uniref:terminase small subunit n=1 Tax=Priestia flexa TaxID=86664 RepID=UPI003D02E9FB